MLLPKRFSLQHLFLGTLLVLVVVIFVPIVLATWSAYRSESQHLELQFHETNKQIAFLAKRVLASVLWDSAQELESLEDFGTESLRSCRYLEKTDPQGVILASSMKASRQGQGISSDVSWINLPDHPSLSLGGLIFPNDPQHPLLPLRKRLGDSFLVCLLDPDILHSELSSGLPSLVHRNVYVVDRQGNPLFFGRSELIRQPEAFLQNPPVQWFLQGQQGTLRYRSSISGRERLAFVSTLPELGWGLVVSADIAASILRVQDRFLGMATALLIGAGLALGIFLLFGNVLVRPLLELTARLRHATRDQAEPIPVPRSMLRVHEYQELADGLNAHLSKLRDAEKQTVQAEKLATLGELTAGLAHEIGTPLNVMRGNAQLVKRRLPAEDPNRAVLDKIIVQTKRIADLIRSLLDLARMDKESKEELDLPFIAQQAWSTVGSLYPDVHFSLEAAGALPRLSMRRRMMEHALMNMMVNACQAMEGRGDIRLRLDVKITEGRSCLVLTMTDSGPGIDTKDLPHLFKPFFSTKPSGQGSGLGLALVDRVTREHGGYALAEAPAERGACFTLVFPMNDEENAEDR